jgi:cellulose synthase/poly-beta-1,6-N-acetylglucosamine synthase-like glycosyltransferase
MIMVETQLEVLFRICAALLAYVYIGYPLLVGFLARIFTRPVDTSAAVACEPSVSLLISAYNESPVIAAKIENSLALDYVVDRLEIIVISDCSDDGTDEIVRGYASSGVRLFRQSQRMGKSAALNFAVPQAEGVILVFSDANALYQPDAIRHLVRHFSNPRVGYVVGNARYSEKNIESGSAESEGLYWKLETYLKKKESSFESVVGGDGAIYAIRRELFSPLLSTDINDFMNPLQIVDRGYCGLFEPAAISYEDTAESFEKEYRRKVRIVSRSFNALRRVPGVLNPFRNPRHWLLLISHKLLRWLAPFFLLILFVASLLLWRFPLYRTAFFLQTVFYVLAIAGWMAPRGRTAWKPLALAYYFCLVNVASFVGCIKCFRGELSAMWTPPRQSIQTKV